MAFHKCEVLTEKHKRPNEVDLKGTVQSTLMADLVVLFAVFLFFNTVQMLSGGGALLFRILTL